jgi:glycosyltransferase involved in cell wall biosynthesis
VQSNLGLSVAFRAMGSRDAADVTWRKTRAILDSERPDVVFVMTPPVFAALPAFWYAKRRGARVVLDAHSAAFMHPRWRHYQWLQRALCRAAATTLVHNAHIAGVVERTGAVATLVPDVPIAFPAVDPFERPDAFTVVCVCSYNEDEPVEQMFEAARRSPDVCFYFTGSPKRLPPALRARIPPNVTLTGFLSTSAYGGLLQGADIVMALTTRDHTMLRAAYEAVYQGTPVIVSDWPLLRESFDEGALHVDNSCTQIVDAVARARTSRKELRAGAARLRQRKLDRWVATRQAIADRIQQRS